MHPVDPQLVEERPAEAADARLELAEVLGTLPDGLETAEAVADRFTMKTTKNGELDDRKDGGLELPDPALARVAAQK